MPAKAVIYDITYPEEVAPEQGFKVTVWVHNAGDEAALFRITYYFHWTGGKGENVSESPWSPCLKAGFSAPSPGAVRMPFEDAVITVQSQHLEGETWITDDERTFTVKPAYPYGTIEEADTPIEAEPNVWQPWSVKVHNTGGYGYFGAGILNHSDSPGPVKVKAGGKEFDVPPGGWVYTYYLYARDKCQNMLASASILYPVGGKYVIWLCGLHREGAAGGKPIEWFIDDHREFLVTVGPPTHILTVDSSPISGVPFTLDGLSLITPFTGSVDEGTYTTEVPPEVEK